MLCNGILRVPVNDMTCKRRWRRFSDFGSNYHSSFVPLPSRCFQYGSTGSFQWVHANCAIIGLDTTCKCCCPGRRIRNQHIYHKPLSHMAEIHMESYKWTKQDWGRKGEDHENESLRCQRYTDPKQAVYKTPHPQYIAYKSLPRSNSPGPSRPTPSIPHFSVSAYPYL